MEWYVVPKFNVGQKVFVYIFSEVIEVNIRSIVCETDQKFLYLKGYTLDILDEKSFFRENELYADKEKIIDDYTWYNINLKNNEWMQLIGERDIGDTLDKLLDEEPIPIEECELQVCCGGISADRDILRECCENDGFYKKDFTILVETLINSGHIDVINDSERFPIFAKIVSQCNCEVE